MRSIKSRIVLWGSIASVVLLVLALSLALRLRQQRFSAALMKDIRAGIAAHNIPDPDARLRRYLEERYGSMSDPSHRQEAFLDFFSLDHIKALQLLVKHSPDNHRQDNIDAMARWVESYRSSLSPEERAELNARFSTGEGQQMLKRATAQYNSQDVQYRSATAGVISELLKTIRQVQQPP